MDESGGRSDLRRRPRRVADVLGASFAALLAFTAVPVVLVLVVGNPLSGGLGHTWQPLPRDVLSALALAAWIAWAACASQLIRGVTVYVRRGDIRPLGVASPLDRVAARIAIGVLALTSAGAPLAAATVAGARRRRSWRRRRQRLHPHRTRPPTRRRSSTSRRRRDPHRSVPARASGRSPMRVSATAPTGCRSPPSTSAATWAPARGSSTRPASRPAGGCACPTRRVITARPAAHTRRRTPARPDRLPELLALGIGSLACAALGPSVEATPSSGPLLRRPRPRPRPAAPAHARVRRGGRRRRVAPAVPRVPALQAFEAANCLLGDAIGAPGDAAPRPLGLRLAVGRDVHP